MRIQKDTVKTPLRCPFFWPGEVGTLTCMEAGGQELPLCLFPRKGRNGKGGVRSGVWLEQTGSYWEACYRTKSRGEN
jgi:hypothetical protein